MNYAYHRRHRHPRHHPHHHYRPHRRQEKTPLSDNQNCGNDCLVLR